MTGPEMAMTHQAFAHGRVMTHQAFAHGRVAVARAADDLEARRTAIDARVRGFLGPGWSGPAAEVFHDAWDDWRAGAADVQQGLAAMADLLAATQRSFRLGDDAARADLDRVSARLVRRLG